MSDIESNDPRIAKILGLLDKTTERGCTPEEAEAAFAKAQALMTKYAIDDALLAAGRGERTVDDVIIMDSSVVLSGSYRDPLMRLWTVTCEANDCRMFYRQEWNVTSRTICITGFKSDVQRVLLLGTNLQLQLLREIRAVKPEYDPFDTRSKGMQGFIYRRSFADGWAGHIGKRLQETRQATVAEADVASGGGTLLPALIDKKAQLEEFMRDNFRLGKSRASRQQDNYAGRAAGRRAAERADLGHTRVGGSHRAIGK